MNITVVDSTKMDRLMITDRRMHPNAIVVKSVADMVNQILQRLGNQQIESLQIFGHGASGEAAVADSATTMASGQIIGLDRNGRLENRVQLIRLQNHFAHGAVVTLQGCQIGSRHAGRELIRQLAHLWNVRIRAGAEDQFADSADAIEGPIIEAVPNNGHPRVHLGR
jgi:hypothetical protein